MSICICVDMRSNPKKSAHIYIYIVHTLNQLGITRSKRRANLVAKKWNILL